MVFILLKTGPEQKFVAEELLKIIFIQVKIENIKKDKN